MFRYFAVSSFLLLSVILSGCTAAKATADKPASQEPRKAVDASEVKTGHNIKETVDGKYYIMMDQSERLCSDCDR